MYSSPKRILLALLLATACTGLAIALSPDSEEQTRTPGDSSSIPEITLALPADADTVQDDAEETTIESEPYQHGKATYYGKKWHGRRTSSGERLDNNSYQCAHRTLPFGTMIRVTNKKNGQSCVVKVVDRGPFGKGRVVDLTYQAAKDLGMIAAGVVPVSIEIVKTGA